MMESKEIMRSHYKNLRKNLGEKRRNEAKKAAALIDCGTGLSVLSFASLPTEIDTSELNYRLLSEGRLVLPAVVENCIVLRKVESLENLVKGGFGILEPRGESIDPGKVAFAFIPGLIFDRNGGRIGYGFGHYDRLLARLKCKVGLCFKEQLFEGSLPTDPWDVPVDHVMTF